jgi:hypothetical protein
VVQESFQRRRDTPQIDRLGEQPGVPIPLAADEAVKLLRAVPSAMVRFTLHRPE